MWYVEIQDGERRVVVVRLQSGVCQEQEVRVNGAVFGKSHKLEDEDGDGVSMCNGGGRFY